MSTSPQDAILEWTQSLDRKPESLSHVLDTLLQLEKQSKKTKLESKTQEFIGTWRLQFIGSKSSPNQAAPKNKAGKVLPNWLKIQLSYEQPGDQSFEANQGMIRNRVQIGMLALELSGPWSYDAQRRIMAFDFLFLNISSFGKTLLSIPVRGGKKTEQEFWSKPLKEKAFFRYFWTSPAAIAARGRGGGIALWSRVED